VKTLDFDFAVPTSLIAQTPATERQQAKLLVSHSSDLGIEHYSFADLPSIVQKLKSTGKIKRVIFVVNDTRVYPARVRFETKSGGQGEVFVLDPNAPLHGPIACLMRPLKRRKLGELLYKPGLKEPMFEVANLDPPQVKVANPNLTLTELLNQAGEMPLPPYLGRDAQAAQKHNSLDRERYQTVYASNFAGSAAAPTAGLHFTQNLMEECKNVGAEFLSVTLNVGLGTFLPVKSDHIEDHKMHEELCFLSAEVGQKLSEVKAQKQNGDDSTVVICVGTTAFRTVESFFLQGCPAAKWFSTDIFIHPTLKAETYSPQCTDALITNFHQPCSTLVMLIAALVGPKWRKIYEEAIAQKYRFFSYGDSSLLMLG
jgi:S-adenosylmethionine:tRNA ribosyltransferase-isomerase